MRGENQHFGLVEMLFDPSRDFHPRHTRNEEIDDRNVWALFQSRLKCRLSIGRLGDNIPAWTLLQHRPYSTSYRIVIVCYEDSFHGRLSLMIRCREKPNEP